MKAEETRVPAPGRLLAGRRALITGGVGAIGRAVAERMAWHGAEVVVADLEEEPAAQVAGDLSERHGCRALGIGVDVVDLEGLEAAADRVERELGSVNVVVANAGVLTSEAALDMDLDRWKRVIDVNLTGAFLTAAVFARRMRADELGGSIIFSSSLFGLRGGRGNTAYSASKFGIIGMAQSLAAELAADGIRVNSVCPGQVESAMLTDLFVRRAEQNGSSVTEEQTRFVERIPVGRLGSIEEIADSFVYLASDLASYVTGHALLVDGGWQVG
ncbi:MAG: SDR family NAD(P)-dependent oxidoreductase [Arachnia sp.]